MPLTVFTVPVVSGTVTAAQRPLSRGLRQARGTDPASGSIEQSLAHRRGYGARAIGDLELGVDALEMRLDGGGGDAQPRRDLAGREPLGRQGENRVLPGGEHGAQDVV